MNETVNQASSYATIYLVINIVYTCVASIGIVANVLVFVVFHRLTSRPGLNTVIILAICDTFGSISGVLASANRIFIPVSVCVLIW
jgi:hypothetical protein